MQIFFDSMSAAMPEVANCPVIVSSSLELDQLLPGERCSVREEIDSVQAVARCSTKLKANMANRIQTAVAAASRADLNDEIDNDGEFDFMENELDSEVATVEEVTLRQRGMLCDVLMDIKEKCILPNMNRCYVGHDFQAHMAYLLESLKASIY